jgi:hypothetical protein
MSVANTRLHIEELVLHGIAPGDARVLQRSVEGELQRLLEDGSPRGLASLAGRAELDAGSHKLAEGAGAADIGTTVARGLYRCLDR